MNEFLDKINKDTSIEDLTKILQGKELEKKEGKVAEVITLNAKAQKIDGNNENKINLKEMIKDFIVVESGNKRTLTEGQHEKIKHLRDLGFTIPNSYEIQSPSGSTILCTL